MTSKNRRYKGGTIYEDIDEINKFLKNFDEEFIKELIIEILFYYKTDKEIKNLEDYFKKYKDYDFSKLLVIISVFYRDKLEINYYDFNTKHEIDFKKYLYTDILISLKSGYKYIREREFRLETYELSEKEIKEQIIRNIPRKYHIDNEILDFFKKFEEKFIRLILIDIIYFRETDEIIPYQQYNKYDKYTLIELINKLYLIYINKSLSINTIYIDFLLRIKDYLTNIYEREELNKFNETEIKEKITNEIKKHFISKGGSYKRQIIKKVIRKY